LVPLASLPGTVAAVWKLPAWGVFVAVATYLLFAAALGLITRYILKDIQIIDEEEEEERKKENNERDQKLINAIREPRDGHE
jgi:uncharacterized membrane protein YhdT